MPKTPGYARHFTGQCFFAALTFLCLLSSAKADNLTVDQWLAQNPKVAQQIIWHRVIPGTRTEESVAYGSWSAQMKADLDDAYFRIKGDRSLPYQDPPPLAVDALDNQSSGHISAVVAWQIYTAYVAQSLVAEREYGLNWSLKHYSADQLYWLLNGKSLFTLNTLSVNTGTYKLMSNSAIAAISPGDPTVAARFLRQSNLIGASTRESIYRFLDWTAGNIKHDPGEHGAPSSVRNDTDLREWQWGYRGYPTVKLVLKGKPNFGSRIVPGCQGATNFTRHVLRTINIPVEPLTNGLDGHFTPHFMSDGLMLGHGDHMYGGTYVRFQGDMPASGLLMTRNQFIAYFDTLENSRAGPARTQAKRNATHDQILEDAYNLSVHHRQYAIDHLPARMQEAYCKDQKLANPSAMSNLLHDVNQLATRKLSLSDLTAMNLRQRLAEKIRSIGGCKNIHKHLRPSVNDGKFNNRMTVHRIRLVKTYAEQIRKQGFPLFSQIGHVDVPRVMGFSNEAVNLMANNLMLDQLFISRVEATNIVQSILSGFYPYYMDAAPQAGPPAAPTGVELNF